MNRKILFRGKRVDNNKWVYGDLIQDFSYEKHNYYIGNNDCNEVGDVFYQVNEVTPETIGQYTGLEDKNGNKIFDGDKVMYDYEWIKPNEIGIITWNESNASFQIKGHIPSSSMKHLDRMKVIGNIFDEKE